MNGLEGDYDGRGLYRELQLEASASQEDIRQVRDGGGWLYGARCDTQ